VKDPTTARRAGRRRLGALAAGLLAAAALTVAGHPVAQAHHAHSGGSQPHLNDMHTWTPYEGIEDEHFCVQVFSGSTHAAALAAVKRALYSTGRPSWDLATTSDGATNARVDIRAKPSPCTSYPSAERSKIDFEYHVRSSNASIAACAYSDDISCVEFDRSIRSPSGSHYDFEWAYVYLDSDHLDSDQLINHETGHVLGLMDGGPRGGTWDTSCSVSLMHLPYYGCPNNNFSKPTDNDIRSVRTVIGR